MLFGKTHWTAAVAKDLMGYKKNAITITIIYDVNTNCTYISTYCDAFSCRYLAVSSAYFDQIRVIF